ncbi:MAG: putative manganese transporter [Candidatus Thiodiazotropha sp.]
MTALVQSVRQIGSGIGFNPTPIVRRLAPLACLIAVISVVPEGWTGALDALSEAYLAVSVFVAGTLALIYAAERGFKTDLGTWLMRYRQWQVPAGALLGAFPGCGGAIVAMTQYTRGYLSFGGVVATLTATMGDAMFLLLASEPVTGMGVLAMGVVLGTLSGYLIDAIHGDGFMRPEQASIYRSTPMERPTDQEGLPLADKVWLALVIPGLVIGVMSAFQIDFDGLISGVTSGDPGYWLGVSGAILAMAMWAGRGGSEEDRSCRGGEACEAPNRSMARRIIDDTNFITTWVVFAFIGYELLVAEFGLDPGAALAVWAPLVPAMAVAIGLIPGCGPQILVTSLYVSGAIPLSAQLGNALANDGDALLPAIAVAPRAALVATLYSAVPAILAAYAWYMVME